MNVYPVTQGDFSHDGYEVWVNNQKVALDAARVSLVPFNRRWPGHQRQLDQSELVNFLSMASDEPLNFRIRPKKPFEKVAVRPLSLGIVPEVSADGDITFTLEKPAYFTVEPYCRENALHIFVDPLCEYNINKESQDVIYYGAGIHEVGDIVLKSNQTLFIDEGAVVYGSIKAIDAENIKIIGKGILDNSHNKEVILYEANVENNFAAVNNATRQHTIQLEYCTNVEIEGITIRDSLVYNIRPIGCSNLRIKHVKIIGCWRFNSDGIDMHNCVNVDIDNCFLRTFDDSICIKGFDCYYDGDVEEAVQKAMYRNGKAYDIFTNVRVRNCVIWNDWGKCLEIGAETRAKEIYDIVFEDGELFGLQTSGKDFTLSTLDHNFGVEDKLGGLKVVPVSNGKVEIGSDIRNKLAKAVDISQDYLIFAVLEGRDVSFDDLTAEQMTGDIELAGFNELGADYAGTGAEAETVKSFSVISEVGTVEYNDLQITDDGFRLDDRGSDQYELSNGRTVLVRNYEVTRSAPNPGTHTLRCEIPVTINGFDDEGAQRKITLVQNPYTWNVTVGKLLAQDNSTTTLVIDTKGPWTVNIPEAADWWQSSVTEWQGEGYKEIVIESTKWNLDLENDWPALLEVSNSLNALRSDMTLIKEHYHFNIGENLVTDRETARTVLAELRKKDTDTYAVEVDCSGEWQAEYTLPDWGNISDLGNGTQVSGNDTFTLGALTKNTEEYDRGAKIVFTSLTHQNGSEPQVVTDTLYITQLKHVFGWEPDEWTDETRNQYCNQPAYIVGGGTHTFGFETTFSDTWSLRSDQPWVKFHMGDNTKDKSQQRSH